MNYTPGIRSLCWFGASVVAAVLALAPASAEDAQLYPSRNVRLVVPATPGGPIDAVARILADGFKSVWAAPVIVENRSGAGTTTGTALVAAAAPDGYTLLITPDSMAVNPSLYPSLSYDPIRSFEPLALVGTATQVLVVRPGLGVTSLRQFLDLAKRKGADINMASAGTGTISHLTEVLLEQRSGIAPTHIPFKGAAPALTAMLGSHVDGMWVMLAPAVPYLKSGTLVPIAVTSDMREPNLPGVPTVEESGVPDFLVENLLGLFAPAGTPKPIVDKIVRAVAEVLAQPDVKTRMATIGFTTRGEGPEVVAALVRHDLPKWAEVVRRAGIRIGE
jgi:tripartite-type tricarboxylate transporter receptor subunit TctC